MIKETEDFGGGIYLKDTAWIATNLEKWFRFDLKETNLSIDTVIQLKVEQEEIHRWKWSGQLMKPSK
jgi:hypothetical protein